jgi:CHAT domain-containing protein/Flp pilus assembly protein TadD
MINQCGWNSLVLLLCFILLQPASGQSLEEAQELNARVMQLCDQGKYAEALPLAQRVLEIRLKSGGKNLDTAGSYNNLSFIYYQLGDYVQAEPLINKVVEIQEEIYGKKHPNTALSYNNLGLFYQTMGNYSKSKSLLEKALVLMQELHGEKHADTAHTYNNLGELYRAMGNFGQAEISYQKSLAIYADIFGPKHQYTALSYNNLGELYRAKGNYQQAETYYLQALAIHQEILGEKHPSTATSYNNLGLAYQAMAEYGKAERFYLKALSIHQEVLGEKHPNTALGYNNLGLLYHAMGDYQKAETSCLQALALYQAIFGEKHPHTAKTYSNLGAVRQTRGDYGQAEQSYHKALAVRKELLGEKHPDTAQTYNNLGTFYFTMGDYLKGIPFMKKALAIYIEVLGEKHADTAQSYNNLGELYREASDYEKAEPLLQKGLALRSAILGDQHPDTAQSYNNLGVLYVSLGDYAQAEPLLEKALMINRKILGEKHPYTAMGYHNLGAIYSNLGDYAKVEPFYQKALAIHMAVFGEKHPHTATSFNNLGVLYEDMQNYAQAGSLLKKALEIRKGLFGEKHPDTLSSYNSLGYLYLAQGETSRSYEIFHKQNTALGLGCCYLAEERYAKALPEFQRSLQDPEKSREKEHVIACNIGLGLAQEGLGNYSEAKRHFSQAIEIMELQRNELAGVFRESFLAGKVKARFSRLEAYEGMIRVLFKEKKTGYALEALNCFERAKARLFLEMLTTRSLRGKSATDQQILQQDKEFQVKLMSLQKLLNNPAMQGDKAPAGRKEEARKELEVLAREYEIFIKEIKLKNSELASLITTELPAVGQIQPTLDPDVTLLEYYTAQKATYVWLMTRTSIQMFGIATGAKQINQLVNSLLLPNASGQSNKPARGMIVAAPLAEKTAPRLNLNDQEGFDAAAREIYELLIAPLRQELTTAKLIIVPHGSLHKLPFSALSNGTRCLADDYSLSVLPSASIIPQVIGKRKTDNGALLALGNPQTDVPSLPAAEQEVKNLGRIFPKNNTYVRQQATKIRLKKESAGPAVVHLACHGDFNDRQPLQSGLLLAKGGDDDGRLRVHDVSGLDLKNAGLVTLSACQTALGLVSSGDDMVGLARAFLYAGTPALLASLWEVEDASTALLMEYFYDNWRNKKLSKPEALRQAQLSLKLTPRYQHPYYWAAFVLIGDWQ